MEKVLLEVQSLPLRAAPPHKNASGVIVILKWWEAPMLGVALFFTHNWWKNTVQRWVKSKTSKWQRGPELLQSGRVGSPGGRIIFTSLCGPHLVSYQNFQNITHYRSLTLNSHFLKIKTVAAAATLLRHFVTPCFCFFTHYTLISSLCTCWRQR